MGSLRDCLRKFGKAIGEADKEDLHARSKEYQKDGHDVTKAEAMAVQSHLDETQGHLDSIYKQATEGAKKVVAATEAKPKVSAATSEPARKMAEAKAALAKIGPKPAPEPAKKAEVAEKPKAEPKVEAKVEPKSEPKPEPKSEKPSEPSEKKPKSSDLKGEALVARAKELGIKLSPSKEMLVKNGNEAVNTALRNEVARTDGGLEKSKPEEDELQKRILMVKAGLKEDSAAYYVFHSAENHHDSGNLIGTGGFETPEKFWEASKGLAKQWVESAHKNDTDRMQKLYAQIDALPYKRDWVDYHGRKASERGGLEKAQPEEKKPIEELMKGNPRKPDEGLIDYVARLRGITPEQAKAEVVSASKLAAPKPKATRWVDRPAIKIDGFVEEGRPGENHLDFEERIRQRDDWRGEIPYNDVGFVDNNGKFITRQEAAKLAVESGQLKEASKAIWQIGAHPQLESDAFQREREFSKPDDPAQAALDKINTALDNILRGRAPAPSSAVDSSTPASHTFREPAPGEIDERRTNSVARFERALNAERGAEGGPPLKLTVRSLATGEEANAAGRGSGDSGGRRSRGMALVHRGLEMALGKRIIFVEPSEKVDWKALSLKSDPGTILINTDAKHPLAALVGHEFGHNIRITHPELYKTFHDAVLESNPVPESYRKWKKSQGYSDEQVSREWVNDQLGSRFTEPAFWDKVAEKMDPADRAGAFKGMTDAIKEWFSNLAGKLKNLLHQGTSPEIVKDLAKMQDAAAEMLTKYQKDMGIGGNGSEEGRVDFSKPEDEKFNPKEFLRRSIGDPKENLRKKLTARPETGVAKNEEIHFEDSKGRSFSVGASAEHGGKSFDIWKKENTDFLSDKEISDARKWYDELHDKFVKEYGSKEAEREMMAWLAGQQNASPALALGYSMRVKDRINGIDIGKKGGLGDQKIEGILRNKPPEGGYGPKLTDFADAGMGKNTRTYMGDDPRGGAPFVADVHTGRDSGHIDSTMLGRLVEMANSGDLFRNQKQVKLKIVESKTIKAAEGKVKVVPTEVIVQTKGERGIRLKVDMQGSPGDTQYEGISSWGNALTKHLNDTKWKGGKWTPKEAQAVGWMRILRQYGLPEGTVESAFRANTSRGYAEVNYGSGASLKRDFPDLGKQPLKVQKKITTDIHQKIIPKIADIIGGSLKLKNISEGQGVYGRTDEGKVSPATAGTTYEVLGSPTTVDGASIALGYVGEQQATMSVVFGKGGKDSQAIRFRKQDGTKFTQNEIKSLIEAAQLGGLSYHDLPGGTEGLITGAKKDYTPKGFTGEKADKLLSVISEWGDKNNVDLDLERHSVKVTSYGNDWQKNPDGKAYLDRLHGLGLGGKVPRITDLRGEYHEAVREAWQKHAPGALAEHEKGLAASKPDSGLEASKPDKEAEDVLASPQVRETRGRIAQAWDDFKSKGNLEDVLKYSRDAGETQAGNTAHEMRTSVENEVNRNVPKAERQVAADALAFHVEAGNELPLEALAAMREKIENSAKATPKWKKRALAAIDYATQNYQKLNSSSDLYRSALNRQLIEEQAAGKPTLARKNYVPHAQDMHDDSWLFGGGHGMSPTGTSNRMNRKYPTFADSIANGQDPKTLNALDLLQTRVKNGQSGINLSEWQNSLHNYVDEKSGAPLAMKAKIAHRINGDPYIDGPPKGYESETIGNVPVYVHKDYNGLISALTDPSWWAKDPARRAVQKINAGGKSLSLLVDTFHLGRMAMRQSILKLASVSDPHFPVPSYEEGKTLLEHSAAELAKMAGKGEIKREDLPDLLQKKKNLSLLIEHGLNTGHVADNMHQEFVRKLPFLGNVNKFIFEKFQRGAMTESALMEFERQKASYPEMSDAQVARQVAKDVNTLFGNLGRQGLFKSRTAQDIMRLMFLAPQWNEGLIRREIGGVGQIGQSIKDAVVGRNVSHTERTDSGDITTTKTQRRLAMGAVGRELLTGAVGMFVANQILNQYTRKKFTWENPEEGIGAKLSAWIPDKVGGNSPGFFLNPLGVTAEISHLLMNRYERTGSGWDTALNALKSRASILTRPIITAVTKEDSMGQKIRPENMTKEVAKSAIPAPIGGASAFQAVKGLATHGNTETFPGQFQKQLMASGGLKTDQAPSHEQRIMNLAKEFNKTKGITPSAEFYAGDFQDLNQALRRNNPDDVKKELELLSKKKTVAQIQKHYGSLSRHPFTGQNAREAEFIRTLNSEQRTQYLQAKRDRIETSQRAMRALHSLHMAQPEPAAVND